ncbi:MAG TPA: 50S ribosomal protein L24 [Patescibacteria group bacterium]
MKLKKGDTVLIIAGKDRGKTGKIEAVLPTKGRVLVAGVNAFKKHVKPSAQNPQGGVVEAFRAIDASNVMLLDPETQKPTRIGYQGNGKDKVRTSRLTNKAI